MEWGIAEVKLKSKCCRVFAVALATSMAVGFAACGKGEEGAGATTGTATTSFNFGYNTSESISETVTELLSVSEETSSTYPPVITRGEEPTQAGSTRSSKTSKTTKTTATTKKTTAATKKTTTTLKTTTTTKPTTTTKAGYTTLPDGAGKPGTTTTTKPTTTTTAPSTTPIFPTAIAFGADSYKVDKGKTVTVKVNYTPANATKKATFVSSNTGIATVNATTGEVKGVAYGETTIKAIVVNADGASVLDDVCTVKVEAIPVTGILISGVGATSVKVNGTLQLKATIVPENASNKTVKWVITSGNEYATINETTGLLTAGSVGGSGRHVMVSATAQDGSGVVKTAKVNIVE